MMTTEQPTWHADLISIFNAARRQARVLPPDHPYVAKGVRDFLDKLDGVLDEAPSVTLSILDREIYLDGHLLAHESIAFAGLVQDLAERKLESVVFSRGLTVDDLARFIALTNRRAEEIEARGGWKSILEQEAIGHISTDQMVGLGRLEMAQNIGAKVALDTYKLDLESIIASFHEVHEGRLFDFGAVQHNVKMFLTVLMDDSQVLHNLSTIKNKEQYTFYHSVNVAILSLLMGFKLHLDDTLLEVLGAAAILHDIGKMCIPTEILNKPTELTEGEWGIMQSHAVEGAKILLQMPDAPSLPMVVAAQHHAEHTLGGYPSFPGLDRLHMLTEIVAIADVFDALTSDRPYRRAMLPDHAMKIIAGGGGKRFHPVLVKVFAHMSGMFPVGTLVELDTGELAVVVRPNPNDLCRPAVRILRGGAGAGADEKEMELCERDTDNGYTHSIVRSVDPAKYDLHIPSLIVGTLPGMS